MSFPRPGFFRRLAAALLMGLPLVPACIVLGPVFGFLLVLGFYCWAFFIWDHMRLLRQRELAAGLRLALASGVASGYVTLRALDHRLTIARETLAAPASWQ